MARRRPRPVAAVTATEISIIAGKARKVGLRATADPERKPAASRASIAIATTTGTKRISVLARSDCGRSGGAATAISAVAKSGGDRRNPGTKPIVAVVLPACRIGAPYAARERTASQLWISGHADAGNWLTCPSVAEYAQGLRRVAVHADTGCVDVALPAAVPVAALIPSIVDILAARDGRRSDASRDLVAARYQLSRPGLCALRASTTLAQNDIQDGTVLVLTRSATKLPAPCFDDAAEAVSATLGATARRWPRRTARLTGAVAASWLAGIGGMLLIRAPVGNSAQHFVVGAAAITGCLALLAAVLAHRAYQDSIAGLTLGLIATGFSALAGFFVVPGSAGAPNILLAATVAAVAAVLAMRVTGCGTITLTAVSCFAAVIASCALAGVITAVPLQAIGSISAAVSLVLLQVSPRVSIVLARLSPELPTGVDVDVGETAQSAERLATKAVRADAWLTSLVAAFSWSVAVGAISAVVGVHNAGGPRFSGMAFATVAGAVLLMSARSQTDPRRMLALLGNGMSTLSAAFVSTAASSPQHAPWIAVGTATLGGAALFLGSVTPPMAISPVARRSGELLEYLALAAIVPLTCWICDLYGVARSLNLT